MNYSGSQLQWLVRCYKPEKIVFILLETVLEIKLIPIWIKPSLSPIPLLLFLRKAQEWFCWKVWLTLVPNSLHSSTAPCICKSPSTQSKQEKVPMWWGCFRVSTVEVAEMRYGKKCGGLSLSQLVTEARTEHRSPHAGNLGLGWTPPLLLSSKPLAEWPSPWGAQHRLMDRKSRPTLVLIFMFFSMTLNFELNFTCSSP